MMVTRHNSLFLPFSPPTKKEFPLLDQHTHHIVQTSKSLLHPHFLSYTNVGTSHLAIALNSLSFSIPLSIVNFGFAIPLFIFSESDDKSSTAPLYGSNHSNVTSLSGLGKTSIDDIQAQLGGTRTNLAQR